MPSCDYTSNRIQVLHIHTGDIEDLTSVSGIDGNSPSWSPEGTQIAFSGQTSPTSHQGIYLMRADGEDARRLTPASMEAQYPAWSPDGSSIAFHVATGGSGFDVYVMNGDGSNITPIVTGPTQDEWPMWSQDGRQLAFGREGSVSQIVMVDPDGTHERVVTDRGGVPASWAPGGWIVFNCPAGQDRIALCIVRPDGTGFANLPLGSPKTGAGFGAWRP
jgi:Tol biopolymer transport system component